MLAAQTTGFTKAEPAAYDCGTATAAPPPPTRNTVNTTDIARHLSLEPHDDEHDASPAERSSRAQLRVKYDAWRRDNPFSDVLDWTLHVARTRLLQGIV